MGSVSLGPWTYRRKQAAFSRELCMAMAVPRREGHWEMWLNSPTLHACVAHGEPVQGFQWDRESLTASEEMG